MKASQADSTPTLSEMNYMVEIMIAMNKQFSRFLLLSERFIAYDPMLSLELKIVSGRKEEALACLHRFYQACLAAPAAPFLPNIDFASEFDNASHNEHFFVLNQEMGYRLLADVLTKEIDLLLEYREAAMQEQDPIRKKIWQVIAENEERQCYHMQDRLSTYEEEEDAVDDAEVASLDYDHIRQREVAVQQCVA